MTSFSRAKGCVNLTLLQMDILSKELENSRSEVKESERGNSLRTGSIHFQLIVFMFTTAIVGYTCLYLARI